MADPRDADLAALRKEVAALRKLVDTAAELLRCGGASVLVRIEQELEYRMQDVATIAALRARIDKAIVIGEEVLAALKSRKADPDTPSLPELLFALKGPPA